MTSRTGGYITRRLHVPQEVWSQGGAKLANVPEKIRVVEVLCSALEELAHGGADGGALLGFLGGGGGVGGGAREGHAHGFGGAGHGICGVHLKGS